MMISKLPTEILLPIFNLIPFVNKVECMLVCRQWESLIREHSLFHTVTIWNNASFKEYYQKIEPQHSIGTQVEYLVLFDCLENNFKKKYLCTLFPRLRFIHIRQVCPHGIPTPQTSDRTKKELQSFRNHIEHVVDYSKAEFIFLLLQSGLCSQLTTIEVELSLDIDIGSAFVLLLKNAPAVATLKMIRALMLLENLEKIHSNLPLLETLVLKDVCIVSNSIPHDVTPAITLKKLLFHDETPWSRLDPFWLEYIRKKYTNLSHLSLTTTPIDLNRTEDEAKLFTANYIIPLLQSIGPQLEQLKINSNTLEPSLFEHMDRVGCQIKNLDLNNLYKTPTLSSLLTSNQYKYLDTLSLRHLLMFDFESLRVLISLKSLELYFQKNVTIVNLSDLLEMCPTMLESLLIDGAKQVVCNSSIKRQFQIRKLAFGEPIFDDNISGFLSECCPDLNTLLLYNCGLDVTLKLPNTNLYSFEANQTRPDYLIAVKVTTGTAGTMEMKDPRFYLSDTKLPGIFQTEWGLDNVEPPKLAVLKPSEYSRPLFTIPFIELECASLSNLIVNRRVAC